MSEMNENSNVVSVYGQGDALDDFPVLKAFQQYVDAEQAKARKRLMIICVFFGCLMSVVVAVFVALLMTVSSKNQALNDRLIEYAMNRDRQPSGSAVVVQPSQDNSAIVALTAKLDTMQKKLAEDQAKAEKAAAEAAEKAKNAALEAAKPKGPSVAELEVKRLQALLSAEKEKNNLERERQHKEEIEAYRRKHYPELYEPVKQKSARKTSGRKVVVIEEDEDLDALIRDVTAKTYFDEDESDNEAVGSPSKTSGKKARDKTAGEKEKEYSIPVDVKGSSMRWNIPND